MTIKVEVQGSHKIRLSRSYKRMPKETLYVNQADLPDLVKELLILLAPNGEFAKTEPLVLYFGNEQDRANMVEACKLCLPNARAIPV